MRIWSLHPKYLDSKGLVALWRETLLAKKVLSGETKGYKNHPQLSRFKECSDPIAAIDYYLYEIWKESDRRSYKFNKSKFSYTDYSEKIKLSTGQLQYEVNHLIKKLHERDVQQYELIKDLGTFDHHPLFDLVDGGIESWEKINRKLN